MTDPISNERLARELWKKHGGTQHGPRTETLTMPEANFNAFVSDLLQSRRQSPAGVEVKGLEWRAEGKGWFRAPSELGAYRITHYAGMKSGGFKLEYGGGFTSYFNSLEAAKSAAQADCDSRVLSSLSVKEPEGVEPTGWFHFDASTGEYTGEWCSVRPADATGFRPLYASPPPKAVTITDEMVERASRAFAAIAFEAAFEADAESEWHRIASPMRAAIAAALSSEAHNG